MLDGAGLRESWYTALEVAQTNFRQLLTSHSSPDWKRVNDSTNASVPSPKGKARASPVPQLTDVILHRKVVKGESVYRAVLDVPLGDDGNISLDACKSVLLSPELRREWDPAVEGAQLLEMCDQTTRVVKTNFTLGWPASPRDAVTISRTFNDATTLIDISTSLPRSPDAPTYLRPSPPYVRSEVALFAWCIQLLKPQSQPAESSSKPVAPRLRMTCFWQHDLRTPWNFGSASSFVQQLNAMMLGFFKIAQSRGRRIPLLLGYGNGISVERIRFENDREALSVNYSIVPEDEDHHLSHSTEQGMEELHAIKEHRRLTRSVECALPANEGWDVQVSTKASSEEVSRLPWTVHATRDTSVPETPDDKVVFLVKHTSLPNDHAVLKVTVVIERSSPAGGIRLNGINQPIEKLEERDPSSYFMSEQMLQDASSTADMSLRSRSTFNTGSTSTLQDRPPLSRTLTIDRSAAAEKSILSRVKRNYIYFSSLLQEPEAKWKRTTEAKGVSIAQLDSIDPTLVVYRAEATFVGLGLWDLYATIVSPGARVHWDKLYDDAVLLEDVNELTELWHYKTKPAWPVVGRDAVVLKTVYKSSSTIHVFAFSADDPNLFPHMPPADSNVIRTQVDLQGWSIEALSPTTTLLTLLEQSDPKGWTNKTSIPQQMITAVTGVGEFAIKCGGPPIVTRLDGAKANDIRYDHERGSFRVEYESAADRRTSDGANQVSPAVPVIECEIRCDLDVWATSLDIVVDPPPLSITCLRRHRLSSGGGGLWLTISHDAIHSSDERLQAIVRHAPQGGTKERGLVMVNGAKVDVDVEELPEREAKNLAKKKRIKPIRIPLDQPPVEGAIRRRKAEWDAEQDANTKNSPATPTTAELSTSAPRFVSTWTKYFNYAVEQATTTTQQAVAAISPATGLDVVPSSSKTPMQYALDALSYVQGLHSSLSTEGWAILNEKDFPVYRKVADQISLVIPVHKGEKVIEGVSAEEVASVITSYDCRKQWDIRFDSASILESFGAGSHTAFVVTKGGFPFRDRGFYLANIVAHQTIGPSSSRRSPGDTEQQVDSRAAIFCVSASFSPQAVSSFSQIKYNPYTLPVGRVFVDGWILETLDPYTAENYAIPSTRCTRVVAFDYGGSVPAAVNSMINGMLPKSILAVETYMKSKSPPPFMRQPAANLVVPSKHDDDPLGQQWSLRRRDPTRISVATSFEPITRTYHSITLIKTTGQVSSIASSTATNDRTPRPSRLAQSPRTPSPAEGQRTSSDGDRPPTSTTPAGTPTTARIVREHAARSRSRDAPTKSPSMFTVRGEVRHPVDLLVAELVVDSKLYPEGYEVITASHIERTKAALPLPATPSAFLSSNSDARLSLPIAFTIYTLPPSPHHSSGLNVDRPPRHLLRLILPTAQYQMSTINDPLTGETRRAPPKPQWFLDLEEYGRAVVNISIKPCLSGQKGDRNGIVVVDGKHVPVLTEKESLMSFGRDDLLDGRIAKMDMLVRSTAESEPVPTDLQVPIAVAEHLQDESIPKPTSSTPSHEEAESPIPADEEKAVTTEAEDTVTETRPADTAASGLMRFWTSYPNPLLRFSSVSSSRPSSLLASASSPTLLSSQQRVSSSSSLSSELSKSKTMKPIQEGSVTRSSASSYATGMLGIRQPVYPLSTLIIAALIGFLLGSLLRSLISPADFIYVSTDMKDAESSAAGGWREIRRLVEVKYIVGGWDFQIAVVRRH